MDNHYILELPEGRIRQMSDHELRELIRLDDLPLEELGTVSEQLDELDHDTLVRLIYHIRRQHEQRKPR